jgi:hypothetical protein
MNDAHSDDDSSNGSVDREVQPTEFVPGDRVIRYQTPFTVAGLTITDSNDVWQNSRVIEDAFLDLSGDDGALEWQYVFRDLVNTLDEEEAQAAARDLKILLSRSGMVSSAPTVTFEGMEIRDQDLIMHASRNELDDFIAQHGFDEVVVGRERPKVTADVSGAQSVSDATWKRQNYAKTPPLCPGIMTGVPVLLVLADSNGNIQLETDAHELLIHDIELDIDIRRWWSDVLSKELDSGDFSGMERRVLDNDTYTSASNRRPRAQNAVVVVFTDGSCVNVGSHNYSLAYSRVLPLGMMPDTIISAIEELTTAPAGELMAMPGPSQMLHQLMSAILSNALWMPATDLMTTFPRVVADNGKITHGTLGNLLDIQDVRCEADGADILVYATAPKEVTTRIDITSSSGIHGKFDQRVLDARTADRAHLVALSKYDLAAIVMHTCSYYIEGCGSGSEADSNTLRAMKQAKQLIGMATANSLCVEFPSNWFHRYDDPSLESPDLLLQSAINDSISALGHRELENLGEACYNAVINKSISTLGTFTHSSEGEKFAQKRDRLKMEVELRIRSAKDACAVPPLPVSEICTLSHESEGFIIGDYVFRPDALELAPGSTPPRIKIPNAEQFRNNYPVSNITTKADAMKVAALFQQTVTTATGMVHSGPGREKRGRGAPLVSTANKIYASNPYAQFAEIRSDVARLVKSGNLPPAETWQYKKIYSGKVGVWWTLRDKPNSPDGFRMDWFAVSSFEVLGSKPIKTLKGNTLYLWPRQRMRSQEMELAQMAPRKLKYTLVSMLEKMRPCQATYNEVISAFNLIASTVTTATWASGELYKGVRYMSAAFASPASPFDKIGEKLPVPNSYADYIFYSRLLKILNQWDMRDAYRQRSAFLGLPRAFAQLESYWFLWVPSEFADTSRHMAKCVCNLHSEYMLVQETMSIRCDDLQKQLTLLQKPMITQAELIKSITETVELKTNGKLGWSWVGSLAAGHALSRRAHPSEFDKAFAHGSEAHNLTYHLTVRHSARIKAGGEMEKGTVAEMMLGQGVDDFCSIISPTFRFLFINRPIFFNHPKKGEHKDREISITDPDSRIALNTAEMICGRYGINTGVDYLKRSRKDVSFYRYSSWVLRIGGSIQSSDASRYGPMMSNFAISNMLMLLGTRSMHLRWAAIVYARLAFRLMTIDSDCRDWFKRLKMKGHLSDAETKAYQWVSNLPHPQVYTYKGKPAGGYCTAVHMGQGMSHHSSSLLHAGGLVLSVDAAHLVPLLYGRDRILMTCVIMVTSDDSTLLCSVRGSRAKLSRRTMQELSSLFLALQRHIRQITLRLVSVMPNLAKEIIAGDKGEFNSQDTGIGHSCPILGFREAVSLLVYPSSPSLVGDYVSAHANARSCSFAGQGTFCGEYHHALGIDAVEERWRLTAQEKKCLISCPLIPSELINGCTGDDFLSSPCSWLSFRAAAYLYELSLKHNSESEDLDPHTRDSVFGPLMHIRIAMSRQHRTAITALKTFASGLEAMGRKLSAALITTSLHATLSSAKSRNLGRIAGRIRFTNVTPRKFLKTEFAKASMLEHTMNWLDHLSQEYENYDPNTEILNMASRVVPMVRTVGETRSAYPLPPTRRNKKLHGVQKPKFLMSDYGYTPFGRHAVERGKFRGTRVDYGTIEARKATQEYLLYIIHNKLPEHVLYGGRYVSSWCFSEASRLTLIRNELTPEDFKTSSGVQWGTFSDPDIQWLSDVAIAHPDEIVLACHRVQEGSAIFHAVHHGVPYTHKLALPPYVGPDSGRHIFHAYSPSNRAIICAYQGVSTDHNFTNAEPSRRSVERYVHRGDDRLPSMIEDIERENLIDNRINMPIYSHVLEKGGEKLLVCIEPPVSVTRTCEMLPPKRKYSRSKIIATLSVGAYWQYAVRGVAFRAFLEGHNCNDTYWTGAVIGWRLTPNAEPEYGGDTLLRMDVRMLVVTDGLQDPDQLSPFESRMSGGGIKLVHGAVIESIDRVIYVDNSLRSVIVTANHGSRHMHTDLSLMTCDFMRVEYGQLAPPIEGMSAEQARARLEDAINGDSSDDSMFF